MQEKWKTRMKTPILLIVGAVLGVVADRFYSSLSEQLTPPELAIVQTLGDRDVVLRDINGISFRVLTPGPRISKAIVAEVDQHGTKGVIIGTDDGLVKPGYVMGVSTNGEILWEINTYVDTIMKELDKDSLGRSDNFQIVEMDTGYFFEDGNKYVTALAIDPKWFASRLVILDPRSGKEAASFWHPGQLGGMVIADIDKDNRSDVILSGLNNFLPKEPNSNKHISMAFALSPEKEMHAQAVPGIFPPWLPRITGRWYFIIKPQTAVSASLRRDRQEGGQVTIIATNDGRFYHITSEGVWIREGIGDKWREKHPDSRIRLWEVKVLKDTLEIVPVTMIPLE